MVIGGPRLASSLTLREWRLLPLSAETGRLPVHVPISADQHDLAIFFLLLLAAELLHRRKQEQRSASSILHGSAARCELPDSCWEIRIREPPRSRQTRSPISGRLPSSRSKRSLTALSDEISARATKCFAISIRLLFFCNLLLVLTAALVQVASWSLVTESGSGHEFVEAFARSREI